LYEDANTLIDQIIDTHVIRANAAYAFWPAASDDDDVILYSNENRDSELARFHFLRQQWERKGQKDYRSLADYIAPVGSGRTDYLGGFVVTAGIGADEFANQFKMQHDDYRAIMVQAVADRFAEAFAELLHERARRDWGFGNQETLSQEELIAESYRGIRPAAGYPACPDHTEKKTLFDLLDATNNAEVNLTSSFAMHPGASVSGLYFSHPKARYFAVDRITKDQVQAYSDRKGQPLSETERWLSPNLAYEP
jgi:5-methyltetrahydrofolate--homocysteine methyltransferase